jgi:hypothetical protein
LCERIAARTEKTGENHSEFFYCNDYCCSHLVQSIN